MVKGADYNASLEREYKKANLSINKDIEYWYNRIATNNNVSLAEARKMLNKSERAEFKWTVEEYIKYGEENAVNKAWIKELENASAKYQISRLEAMKIDLQQQIEILYGNQTDGLDNLARSIYSDTYYHSAFEIQRGFNIGWDVAKINDRQLERVLSKPWTSDMKTFRDKCWTQKTSLISKVYTELTQSIIRGDSPDKVIDKISSFFNVARSKAGRLVMTESAYFASVAQKDCYNELDVERFRIVATLDSHTSEICQDLDGKVFDMKDYEAGVTAPPFHPWCRSVTVPHFDDDYGERAARGQDGKVYYVPSDMTYKEWKNSFIDGNKKDLHTADDPVIIKDNELNALRKAIFDKNESFLSDIQKSEFENILKDMDEGKLKLYDAMSENFSLNNYHLSSSGAAYYPYQHRVLMDIDINKWENLAEIQKSGAWNTKFHEEFHQLDHILGLSKTSFAQAPNGMFLSNFTDTNSNYGKRMIEAIDNDILNAFNSAIDRMNELLEKQGLKKIKSMQSLNSIPRDAPDSLVVWLKEKYPTERDTAMICPFTDAAGLSTKNKFAPFKTGFWGHSSTYNKERGKNGATSETWANLGAAFMNDNEEQKKILSELMPSAWKVYTEIINEVIEYASGNTLSYPK